MVTANVIRSQIITVDKVEQNAFGDLIFTDKEGKEYPKIKATRKQYFEKVIIPNVAVQLNYAIAYGKEYIYSAVQVKEGLPPPVNPPEVKSPDNEGVRGAKPLSKPIEGKQKYKADPAKTQSIEKQTSLKSAVELVVPSITPDKPVTWGQIRMVIKCARLFDTYLNGDLEIRDEEFAKLVLQLNKEP